MNSNKLVINVDKIHLMVMGSKRHRVIRDEVVISVGGYSVKPTETERLLGGYLHQDMTWNVHIQSHQNSLINQLNSRINGLKKVCKNASFETRLMVANMSKLMYLITLWG